MTNTSGLFNRTLYSVSTLPCPESFLVVSPQTKHTPLQSSDCTHTHTHTERIAVCSFMRILASPHQHFHNFAVLQCSPFEPYDPLSPQHSEGGTCAMQQADRGSGPALLRCSAHLLLLDRKIMRGNFPTGLGFRSLHTERSVHPHLRIEIPENKDILYSAS